MLYLVATPIGNLKDISLRALDVLRSCSLILCEDTRHSKILLNHYDIKTSLLSLHKFNEVKRLEDILIRLRGGEDIALISDAGTPCIQDPGALLVKACQEEGLSVTSIPGPSALAVALSLCGEEEGPFQFVGFLPKKSGQAKSLLISILQYSGHSIAYLSPHQLLSVLEILSELAPERPLLLFKELTKHFEQVFSDTALNLFNIMQTLTIKGEFVIMIKKSTTSAPSSTLSAEDLVSHYETTYQLSKMDAIKLAAKDLGLSKRELYNSLNQKEES